MGFIDFAAKRERKKVDNIICHQIPIYKDNVKTNIIKYGEGKNQFIWTFTPEEYDNIIVNIHGGGLIAGQASQNRNLCLSLTEKKCKVYSIEYDLVPEVSIYDQINEIFQALSFIKIDPERKGKTFLIADSAGALLGLIVNAGLRNPFIREDWKIHWNIKDFHFDGCYFQSGMFNLVGFFNPISWLMCPHYFKTKNWREEKAYKYLKHLSLLTIYLPNTILATTAGDFKRKDSLKLSKHDFSNNISLIDSKTEELKHAELALYPLHNISRNVNSKAIDLLIFN